MFCKYCGRLLTNDNCYCNRGQNTNITTKLKIFFSAMFFILPVYFSIIIFICLGKKYFLDNIMIISSYILI